ncbi:MAG: hypothetical protein JNK87_09965 [Bryobacterales bacterium]|nr:hypothetical protein [Bryobacterales bacterium]
MGRDHGVGLGAGGASYEPNTNAAPNLYLWTTSPWRLLVTLDRSKPLRTETPYAADHDELLKLHITRKEKADGKAV